MIASSFSQSIGLPPAQSASATAVTMPELYRLNKKIGGIYLGIAGDIDPALDPNKEWALFVPPQNLKVSGKTLWSIDEAIAQTNSDENGFKIVNPLHAVEELKAGFASGTIEGKEFVPTLPILETLVAHKNDGDIKCSLITSGPTIARYVVSCTPDVGIPRINVRIVDASGGYDGWGNRDYQVSCRRAFAVKVSHLNL